MALRTVHGKAAQFSPGKRVEVLPADELPLGVQAPEQESSTTERAPDGTWLKGCRTDQQKGGRTNAGSTRLARKLGLESLPDDAAFKPYKKAASAFRRFHVTNLARTVGGGHCGPAPASIIATAAWQLAASRYLFDQAGATGDSTQFALASRLANDSRQNLLAAHELCALEARARQQQGQAQTQTARAVARLTGKADK